MASDIKIPRLSESGDMVQVTEVHVKAGDQVEQDQVLIVVNADKSTADVRAPMAGKVVALHVKVGDEVKVGKIYCSIEGATADASAAAPAAPTPTKRDTGETPGVAVTAGATRVETKKAEVVDMPAGIVAASPGTRWLARKLGVELSSLRGSGPRGRITEDDVKGAANGAKAATGGGTVAAPPLPNFEKFGAVVREPLSPVRKLTARQMSIAWSNIPHVTQFDLADITDLEAFRKSREGKGPKVTVTAFVMKACASALKQFPTFNSSLDLASGQLILKQYVNIGVAVDTKGGLLVPVIKDVDKKGVNELAQELNDTAEKARTGKADMSGGTFTITNLGGIGGTGFTPIVNWPEVAILGLSRGRIEPVWKDGAFVPRLMVPLSLSYDHRVIDGADAARFTRRIAEMLENPWLMTL